MTSQLVTVRPGAPQLVTSNPAGTPIAFVNRDSNNGVWIGSDKSVEPGQGFYLAALASTTWTPSGSLGAVYACVDDGVTSPVELNMSTEAESITDPVAVATATATRLLEQGVSIAQNVAQLDDSGTINPGVTYQSPIGDCGSYQSLVVSFAWSRIGAHIGDMFRINVSWFTDAQGTTLLDNDVFFFAVGQNTNTVCHPTMRVPTRSRYFFVSVIPQVGSVTSSRVETFGYTAPTPSKLIRNTAVPVVLGTSLLAPPLLIGMTGLSIPAGSNVQYYLPPVLNAVRLNIATANAPTGTVTASLQGGVLDYNNNPAWYYLGNDSNQQGATTAGTDITVPAGVALLLTVTNNDTSARSPVVEVWDTSH